MVTRAYLLNQPPAPSSLKRWIDQVALPVAIDLAAQVEAGAEKVAVTTRGNPLAIVVGMFGLAFLAAHARGRTKRVLF